MSALYRALEITHRSSATERAAAPIAEAAATQAAAAMATSRAIEQRGRSRASKRRLRLAMMAGLPAVALLALYGVDHLTTPNGAKSLSTELVESIGGAVEELFFGSSVPTVSLPVTVVAAPAAVSPPAAVPTAATSTAANSVVQPVASAEPASAPPAPQPVIATPQAAVAPATSSIQAATSFAAEPPPLMSPIAVAPMTVADGRAPEVLNPAATPVTPPVQAEAPEPLSPMEVAAALRIKPPKSPLSPSEVQKTLERAVSGERQTLASLGMLSPSEPVRIERSTPPGKSLPQITVSMTAPSDKRDRLDRYKSAHNAAVTGDLPLSVSLYQEILRDSPSDATALFGLASAQQRLGRDAEARAAYEKLLKLDPENAGAMSNMLALIGRSQPEEALLQLEDLRKNHPNSPSIVAQLAGLYANQGMLDRAIANAKQAVEMAPGNLFYLYNLAILHDRAGRRGEAARSYREVLQRVGSGEAGGLSLPVDDIRSRLAYLSQ